MLIWALVVTVGCLLVVMWLVRKEARLLKQREAEFYTIRRINANRVIRKREAKRRPVCDGL